MFPYSETVSYSVNTDFARACQQIVTAGWANLSDGDVDAPGGAFALISIEPAELDNLIDSVFDGEEPPVKIYPGNYVVVEDSNGNAEIHEFVSHEGAMRAFEFKSKYYTKWAEEELS